MSGKLEYRSEIYVAAPPSKVWQGLTDGELTRQYVYGTRFTGRLERAAPYAYLGDGGVEVVEGEILEVEPEQRLVMTWRAHWDDAAAKDPASRVTWELSQAAPGTTRLRVVHDDFPGPTATYAGAAASWPYLLSSLKSLLETGHALPAR